MPDVLLDKQKDGVAIVTLNRPDSLNAMGGQLMEELGDALRDVERDADVRVVALTGAGRGFCAGGDIKGFASRAGSSEAQAPAPVQEPASFPIGLQTAADGLARNQERSSLKLHTMLKPTVAIVNGPAAGAGMSLALSCDIRLVSDKARFVPAFGRIAFSGDFGGSYYLTKLIGFGRAREVYFMGDPIDAGRALDLGIANHVYPHEELMERSLAYCARLAEGPPYALGLMKKNFLFAEHGRVDEALTREAFHMQMSGRTKDHREGVRAFVEKRDPTFSGD